MEQKQNTAGVTSEELAQIVKDAIAAKIPDVVAQIKKTTETKAETKTETKSETKAETKAETKSETKAEATEITEIKQLKDQLSALAIDVKQRNSIINVGNAHDDKPYGHFKSRRDAEGVGNWLKYVVLGDTTYKTKAEEYGIKSLSTSDPSRGGVFVPSQMSTAIIDLLPKYGNYSKYGTTYMMESDTWSGVELLTRGVAYWTGEGIATTESNPTFGSLTLSLKEVSVLYSVPAKLINDSPVNVANVLVENMAQLIAEKKDDAAINGDGTSTYGGILGLRPTLRALHATASSIAGLQVGSGASWSALTSADFDGTLSKLPSRFRNGASWIMSSQFWYAVPHKLLRALSGNNAADLAGGIPLQLGGLPVLLEDKMPTATASGSIVALLGNFGQAALIGEKDGFKVAQTNAHASTFSSDVLTFRGESRTAYTVIGAGSAAAAGAYVGLITS